VVHVGREKLQQHRTFVINGHGPSVDWFLVVDVPFFHTFCGLFFGVVICGRKAYGEE
jgi:hypothetical protein